MYYYYLINSQQLGPVKAEELVSCGVTAETLVWTEGMANWVPAKDVAELRGIFEQQLYNVVPGQTMTFMQSIRGCFNKFMEFNGRASRAEFWWFYLFQFLLSFIPGLGLVISFILLIPYIAVAVRRLHDTNHSGWWILCPIYNLILFATRGDNGDNRYGEPPLM